MFNLSYFGLFSIFFYLLTQHKKTILKGIIKLMLTHPVIHSYVSKQYLLSSTIEFSGGAAIKSSEAIGLEKDLPENFVETSVPTMYAAIQKLCTFVRKYS